MDTRPTWRTITQCICLLAILSSTASFSNAQSNQQAAADDYMVVHLVALFENKAMISVAGSRPKVLTAGQDFKGVSLISATTQEAVVEIAGERQTLRVDGNIVLRGSLLSSAPNPVVQLQADQDGFFRAAGSINNVSTSFLVDTGANLVVLSSQQADSMGLDYEQGVLSSATTASGRVPMYLVKFERVNVGRLELNDIEAGIVLGAYPQEPLLGTSVLDKLDMQRNGNSMVLKKRR